MVNWNSFSWTMYIVSTESYHSIIQMLEHYHLYQHVLYRIQITTVGCVITWGILLCIPVLLKRMLITVIVAEPTEQECVFRFDLILLTPTKKAIVHRTVYPAVRSHHAFLKGQYKGLQSSEWNVHVEGKVHLHPDSFKISSAGHVPYVYPSTDREGWDAVQLWDWKTCVGMWRAVESN